MPPLGAKIKTPPYGRGYLLTQTVKAQVAINGALQTFLRLGLSH